MNCTCVPFQALPSVKGGCSYSISFIIILSINQLDDKLSKSGSPVPGALFTKPTVQKPKMIQFVMIWNKSSSFSQQKLDQQFRRAIALDEKITVWVRGRDNETKPNSSGANGCSVETNSAFNSKRWSTKREKRRKATSPFKKHQYILVFECWRYERSRDAFEWPASVSEG